MLMIAFNFSPGSLVLTILVLLQAEWCEAFLLPVSEICSYLSGLPHCFLQRRVSKQAGKRDSPSISWLLEPCASAGTVSGF